jgi:catechol 2,3-dioxygenase-like lactoylglutathione lyase family enzyme
LAAVRVVSLHHVNVRVDDLAAAAAFYGTVLGLARVDRPDVMPGDGWWYDLGDGRQLHVSEGGGNSAATASSAQHFCLLVDDWRAAITDLRGAGLDVEVREPTGQAFVRDPSGNRIELNQATPHL